MPDVFFLECLKVSETILQSNLEILKAKSLNFLTLLRFCVSVVPGTGGAGAFFFFLRKDIPSVDDDKDDVDPLKLCPGELWFDSERGVGSGVAECLQYLYFNIFALSLASHRRMRQWN